MPKTKAKKESKQVLFTDAELGALDLARSVLASKKMRLLRDLMGYHPESNTAYLMRKQCNAVTKSLDNFANWRLLMDETKGD